MMMQAGESWMTPPPKNQQMACGSWLVVSTASNMPVQAAIAAPRLYGSLVSKESALNHKRKSRCRDKYLSQTTALTEFCA
jgi:hypothetical protein